MTEMNGLTMEFTTQPYDVVAGTTYHLKLAIADGKGVQLLQCQQATELACSGWLGRTRQRARQG